MAPKRSNDQKEEEDKKSSGSGRVIAVLSAEGYTGSSVIELLYSDGKYSDKFDKLVGITFGEATSPDVKAIHEEYSVETVSIDDVDEEYLKSNSIDTALIIPPARKDKLEIVKNFLETAKKAQSVKNVVLLSAAGAEYAGEKQPRLREFLELEVLTMQPKSDTSSGDTGHSPCIVRGGFYLENLLVYSKQAQSEGKLPIPIDEDHKFAAVALGDVAQLLAYIITSKGEQGLDDDVRGQLITLTGPLMHAGPELAEAASQGLGTKLEFQSIKESEAKKVLKSSQGEELDEAEREYLLEYYSLVREGKTNYVAGRPVFKQLLGTDLTEPSDWFHAYEGSFTGKNKKRKISKDDDEGDDEKSAKEKQSEGGKKGGKASGSSNKKTVTSSSGGNNVSAEGKEAQREGGRKGGKASGKKHDDDDDEVLEDADDDEGDDEKSAKQKQSEGGKKGGKATASKTKKDDSSSKGPSMSDDAKERQREGGRKGGKASGKQHNDNDDDDDDEVLEDAEDDDGDDNKSAKQKQSEGGKKGGKATASKTKKDDSSSKGPSMSDDAKERQREGGRKGGKASGKQHNDDDDDDEVLEDADEDDKEKSAKQKQSEGGKKGGKASGSSNKKNVTSSPNKSSGGGNNVSEEGKEAQREGGRKGGKASGKKQDADGDEDLEDADPDAEYVE